VAGRAAGAEHDRGNAGRRVYSGLRAAGLGAEIEGAAQGGECRQAGTHDRGVCGGVERRIVALDVDLHVETMASALLIGEAFEGFDDAVGWLAGKTAEIERRLDMVTLGGQSSEVRGETGGREARIDEVGEGENPLLLARQVKEKVNEGVGERGR